MKLGIAIVVLWFVAGLAFMHAVTVVRERAMQAAELGWPWVLRSTLRRWIPTLAVIAAFVAVVILDPGHGAP